MSTNRAEKTMVEISHFQTIAQSLGYEWLEQKGFVKLQAKPGITVYVGKTKRVGRVDISGFEVPEAWGVVNLGELAFGAVKQQVDFCRPQDDILATFRRVLEHALTLEARIKPKAAEVLEPGEDPAKVQSMTPAELKARKKAIAQANAARIKADNERRKAEAADLEEQNA